MHIGTVARSARRLSVLPARNQRFSVERSSGVKVMGVGCLLMPHHGIYRLSAQLSTRNIVTRTCDPPLGTRLLAFPPQLGPNRSQCAAVWHRNARISCDTSQTKKLISDIDKRPLRPLLDPGPSFRSAGVR